MPAKFITPVEINVTATGWQTYDLDSIIANLPASMTGVILEVLNTSTGTSYNFQARHPDQSTELLAKLREGFHSQHYSGVNAAHEIEINCANATYLVVYVIAYLTEGFYFFNDVNKNAASAGSWQDVDCSDCIPADAIGVLYRMIYTGTTDMNSFGLHEGGSSYSMQGMLYAYHHVCGFCKVDENRLIRQIVTSTSMDLYIIGYVTPASGIVFYDEPGDHNVSLSTAGADVDLAALPAGAIGGIYDLDAVGTMYKAYLYPKGGTVGNYSKVSRGVMVSGCDASGIVTGKIENTYIDFYLLGYFTEAASYSGRGVGRGIGRGVMR